MEKAMFNKWLARIFGKRLRTEFRVKIYEYRGKLYFFG